MDSKTIDFFINQAEIEAEIEAIIRERSEAFALEHGVDSQIILMALTNSYSTGRILMDADINKLQALLVLDGMRAVVDPLINHIIAQQANPEAFRKAVEEETLKQIEILSSAEKRLHAAMDAAEKHAA
jgi:hypothetical protein